MKPGRWDDDLESRTAFRERMLRAEPRYYSPWLHLAGTTGPALVLLVAAIVWIGDLRAAELLVIPAVIVLSNLFEWHVHRSMLHRRWRLFPVIYDQHTPMHHRVYRYGDMAIRSIRELRLILIPGPAVGGIILMQVPLAALLGWLVTPNVGALFLVTSGLYVVSYELSHLAYHLPPESFIGRRPLVRWLREHHARHHDPRLMQRWNFNVTLPLGDWLFGTMAPADVVAQAKARIGAPWRDGDGPAKAPCEAPMSR